LEEEQHVWWLLDKRMSEHITHPYLDQGLCFGCSSKTDFKPIGRLVMCKKCFSEKLGEKPSFWSKLE